jgi:hypothetical protein
MLKYYEGHLVREPPILLSHIDDISIPLQVNLIGGLLMSTSNLSLPGRLGHRTHPSCSQLYRTGICSNGRLAARINFMHLSLHVTLQALRSHDNLSAFLSLEVALGLQVHITKALFLQAS